MDELVEVSEQDRLLAAFAHGSAVLSLGFWVPLVLWLVFRESRPFVGYHAGQAMVFHLGVMVVVIPVALCTLGFGALLLLPWMLYEVYLAIEAFQGRWTGYLGMEHVFRPDGV